MGRNRRKQAAGPRLAVFPDVMRIRLQVPRFAGIKNGDLFGVSVMRGRIISAGCYSSIKSMFTCRWNASCSEIWVSVEETP